MQLNKVITHFLRGYFGGCLTLLLFCPSHGWAENASPRQRLGSDDGWRFTKDDPAGIDEGLSYDHIKAWLLPTSAGLSTGTASTGRRTP